MLYLMVSCDPLGSCELQAGCRQEGVDEGREVDLIGSNPEDRTIDKRGWEKSVQDWQAALRIHANEIRAAREGWHV